MKNWWDDVNESTQWQDGILFSLCGAYALVSAFALVQLVKIQMRTREYGWTTQKFVRFYLDFTIKSFSCIPSLPTDKLRKTYISVNVAVYFAQVVIWVCIWVNDNSTVEFVGKIFMAVVSFIAALGFLHHGGRYAFSVFCLSRKSLFVMLKRFPIESNGRKKKLHEVGSVTAICFTCFLIRCIVVGVSAFDRDLRLDVHNRPVQILIYYMVVETIPSALVLLILRKLPPKRSSA
uniref:THH1/TOM1/TOM3 domain-containing protein n=1 Tax=Brassica campestris TaxID=3711 RepID=M4DAQ0_BRACM